MIMKNVYSTKMKFMAIVWVGCLWLSVSTAVHAVTSHPAVPAVSRSILNWTWGENMATVEKALAENGNVVHVFPHLEGLGTYPGTFMPPAAAREGFETNNWK